MFTAASASLLVSPPVVSPLAPIAASFALGERQLRVLPGRLSGLFPSSSSLALDTSSSLSLPRHCARYRLLFV